jgi:site-specific recombinase XerD
MATDPNHVATALAERSCTGPLTSHTDGFAAQLSSEGYHATTVRTKCRVVAELSRWLTRRRISLAELNEEQVRQFHVVRRRRVGSRRIDPATTHQLLGYLRDRGDVPRVPLRVDQSPLGCLTRDFDRFLSSERGLSRSTSINYLPIVRAFLTERFGSTALRLDDLCPQDVYRFIVRQGKRIGRTHARRAVTALRSFLRFLRQRGVITRDLAGAVPGVATWRLSHLPKSLPPEQVERLLGSCDRRTSPGQRDYAILMLLARLGLRAGEVVGMRLDDFDWEHGEFLVRGKGQRHERLPLPKDVGAAIVRYLRHVRPACGTRRVFIRLKAPLQGLAGPVAICCIVRRALKRAGLDPEFKGSHLLRHSLATDLLRRGASLGEIGHLLRHRQPNTTQIYAKVDIAALRGIALRWPGGAS